MRRALIILGLAGLLAGCAQAGPGATGGGSVDDFDRRARDVARAWRDAIADADRSAGFIPLQELTVLPADPGFTGDTRRAFAAGWFRDRVALPSDAPAAGTVAFPGGTTLTVPLVSAAAAYQAIDRGDPPPCPGGAPTVPGVPAAPAVPTGRPSGPDRATSTPPAGSCVVLTVTAAELGDVTLRTLRGRARVPAWLFTVEELSSPVARVAVDPAVIRTAPTVPPGPATPGTGAGTRHPVAAQDLTGVDAARLTYRLGVGACDGDVTARVHEADDLVVVGGTVRRDPGAVCTDQLILRPVTVTLSAPLGDRPVLDALTGTPLILTVR